ncbi:serine/threonine protein kinase [Myxococcota bacterium]|nr:serine/threonine protein kinase [Myxococcota bacterium]
MDAQARYELFDVIGRGGGGVVYRARDRALDRDVAYKVLRAAFSTERERVRFLAEAQIAAQLEHPNIIPVHDVGTTPDGDVFYVMKRVEGETLGERIKQYHSGSADAGGLIGLLQAFRGALLAVAFAHDRGIVHRDLKPANVLIGLWGEVLVVDWGLARPFRASRGVGSTARDAYGGALTLDGEVVGSLKYMAPEQARGEVDRVGPAADVYALGAMLYAVLTGHSPRKASTLQELLAAYTRRPALPSRRKRGAIVPPGFDRLTLACLEVGGDLRPPDAGIMLQMFDSALMSGLKGEQGATASGEYSVEIPADARSSGESRALPPFPPRDASPDLLTSVDDFEGLEDPVRA